MSVPQPPASAGRPDPGRRKSFVWGMAVGFAVSLVFISVCILVLAALWLFAKDSEEDRAGLPRFTLELASDGCGVIRSEPPGEPPHGLQWVVTDSEGFQVLGRNALGETHFRYFASGEYEVVLQAWEGEKYVDVSNKVSIVCRP